MLRGWLDRHSPDGDSARADQVAAGVITVADAQVPEVEAFCADWDMTVRHTARGDGAWAVLVVEGRPLPVRGFTEITAMSRAEPARAQAAVSRWGSFQPGRGKWQV